MKKTKGFVLLLLCLLLFSSCVGGFQGSGTDGSLPPGSEASTPKKDAPDFEATFLRDGWREDDYPFLYRLTTLSQLQHYLSERGADIPGFDAKKYDAAFFEKKELWILLVEESSGSNRHRVDGISRAENGWQVDLVRLLPEAGTCDMVCWNVVLAVEKGVVEENAEISVSVTTEKLN